MKRIILLLMIAFVATVYSHAQQIAVVSTDGATTLYQTLGEAINGASAGSVIYLPGGGFSISDDVKITKKLTLIGIGHKTNGGNVDGSTTISGNLSFAEGGDGGAVLGCYITGNINIGEGGTAVNDILIKYCNLNSVQVNNSNCQNVIVNQNYIRGTSNYGGSSNGQITNNVLHSMMNIVNGFVSHNIITGAYTYKSGSVYMGGSYSNVAGIGANTSTITYNILNSNVPYNTSQGYGGYTYVYGSNNQCLSNLTINSGFGESSIVLENVDWSNVFVNFNNGTISPNSNFHFTEAYQQYSYCGIYGGTGFSDSALPPVPYISAKRIDEQTDAAGNLTIKIRVKAGGEE